MNKNESLLPVARLHEMFERTPDGRLYWKERPVSHFVGSPKRSAKHSCANWNARYAGTEALCCITPHGHKTGRINNRLFYAHRVVWAMETGHWPENEIDHINGIPDDNRTENLRDVTHKNNLRNQVRRKNNTSGMTGVRFYKPRDAWVASICVDGTHIHIGYFSTADEAQRARQKANLEYGYHENHGRAA